jgi:hypothetical protein
MRVDEFIPTFLSLKSNMRWDKFISDIKNDPVPFLIDAQPNALLGLVWYNYSSWFSCEVIMWLKVILYNKFLE